MDFSGYHPEQKRQLEERNGYASKSLKYFPARPIVAQMRMTSYLLQRFILFGYRDPVYPAFDVQPSIGYELNALPRQHRTYSQEGNALRDAAGGLVAAPTDSAPRPRFLGF